MTSNKPQVRLLFFLSLLFVSESSYARQDVSVDRVLFVGNSYTYYHSMPQLFKAMSEYKMPGHRVDAKFIGGGGATLKKHWEVGQALKEIRTGRWDYVVLQGQSMLGSTDLADPDSPNQFFEYARMFDREIRKNGAETVFFMTWSRKNQKQLQHYLTNAYLTIGNETGSKVAPVGLAWSALRDNPNANLYMDDGSHPSIVGSYLAAMTLSEVIFGAASEDYPGELYGHEILRGGALADTETRLSHLPNEQVQLIQHAVADGIGRIQKRVRKAFK